VAQRLSQLKTNCIELNGLLNFDTLSVAVNAPGQPTAFAEEELEELCHAAGDKGFDVRMTAWGEDAAFAVAALSSARDAGCRKSAFTLICDAQASSLVINEEEPDTVSDICSQQNIAEINKDPERFGFSMYLQGLTVSIPAASACIEAALSKAATLLEAAELLTLDAAEKLGISEHYGTIESGKAADFVIFPKNFFETDAPDVLKTIEAAKTVINGNVVYDAAKDDPAAWHTLLSDAGSSEEEFE